MIDRPPPDRSVGFVPVESDLQVIRRLVGPEAIAPVAGGLDHRAYLVGNDLVARFGADVGEEAALLATIAPRLPLPVPVPVAVDEHVGCMILPRVCGTSLLHVPSPARGSFAPAMVRFAAAVHALDVVVPVDDTPPSAWLDEARETWPSVRERVPSAVHGWLEAFLDAAPPPEVAPCFIHGDLGAEHVFADRGRITGVIDWSDAAIGDPAVDHGRLMRDFGVDLGERARFYAVCTALEDLAFGEPLYVSNAVGALMDLSAGGAW